MAVVISSIVWHDEVLWSDGHLIANWANSISNKLGFQVRYEAPINKRPNKTSGFPGELKTSIRVRSSRTGPRSRQFNLSMAGHAVYVLKGTGPVIYPNGRFLSLPVNPGYGLTSNSIPNALGTQPYRSVSGQRANDFLGRAWDKVSLEHSSIRGKLRDD